MLTLLVLAVASIWRFGWAVSLLVVVGTVTILYLLNLLFMTLVVIRSGRNGLITVTPEELAVVHEAGLSTYTVLVPLFHEGEVKRDNSGRIVKNGEEDTIKPLVANLIALDYPTHKKEILFLLEAEDTATIRAVNQQIELQGLGNAKVVVIPKSHPQTKPKACNIGLDMATGARLVIYDAEDRPETDQLKKAEIAFEKADARVMCVQAKLEYRNPYTNSLTKLFASEYATYFGLILPGLARLGLVVPLGGTSNHFKTAELRNIGGWDSFNVTEDIDLGIRISRRGYRVTVMNSTTWEEANSRYRSWVRQRSRWCKGKAQSYLVAMRNPWKLYREVGFSNFLAIQVVVGLPNLMLVLNPVFWALTGIYLTTQLQLIKQLYPNPILYAGALSMIVGNVGFLYYTMAGVMERKLYRASWTVLWRTSLIYWPLMSFAMYKALWQLIVNPHYWEKTEHGLDLTGVVHAREVIGETITVAGNG